jgi:dUTP pyrophosphatase
MSVTVLFKRLRANVELPKQMTHGSSGYDIFAPEDLKLLAHHQELVPCGFAVKVPEGYELQIRPRSGLALKHGITVVNSPGTIDSDYRGEVGVILRSVYPRRSSCGNEDCSTRTPSSTYNDSKRS